jgi:hypothetical protein
MNYTTKNIMDLLAIEKEENSLVSLEMLDAAIMWINIFQAILEIEFNLVGELKEG